MNKYKTTLATWVNGEDIYFSPDGTLTINIEDSSSESGYIEKKFKFNDWNETKANGLTLKSLYEDVMPEFIEGDKLNVGALKDIFPDIELSFNINEEDIYVDGEKEVSVIDKRETALDDTKVEAKIKDHKVEAIKKGMGKQDKDNNEVVNMGGKKAKQINLKLSQAVHDKLTEESNKLGLDKTSFISMLISNYKGVYFYRDDS